MAQKLKDLSILSCEHLTGVGKKMAERLSRLGIVYVQDLLFHLPRAYQDRTQVHPIRNLVPGNHVVIEGHIETVSLPKVGRTRLLCRLRDASGQLSLRFFYINGFQRQQLVVGAKVRCFGEIRLGTQGLEMIHPEYCANEELLSPIEENLTPIYPTTEGLNQTSFRKLTNQALQLLKAGGMLVDVLPAQILKRLTFPTLSEALQFVHRPPPDAPINMLIAGKHTHQKRLVFEELLAHRLSLLSLKNSFQKGNAFSLPPSPALEQDFRAALGFELTQAQKKVFAEISKDLTQLHPMLRLVQGDVGSGKTVVAALAMLQAIGNGFQAALLAPTELLVEQHFQSFSRWLQPLNIHAVLLTGQLKASERRQTLADIASGKAKVIVGTHAIFQKTVAFHKLALIVVDEQHRFGVEQRAALREKGVNEDVYPHQLVMTATPIPRTLAMSVYADLDYSIIDELPPGRMPVVTIVVANSRRLEIIERIRQACASGRQVYWVCTLIEESEVLQCQAAESTAQELQALLTDFRVGLLHGRMKSPEKESVMASFKCGNIDLLVATTVIEVGVDVPNASLMVIENAERLGLAQLHQLRGRVGRGIIASHCVLMYQMPLSNLAKERLNVMRETSDGFKVAERDLALRGPGEVLGTRQTGDVALRIADLARDSDLMSIVQDAATELEREHPCAVAPLIKRWLGAREKYGKV